MTPTFIIFIVLWILACVLGPKTYDLICLWMERKHRRRVMREINRRYRECWKK